MTTNSVSLDWAKHETYILYDRAGFPIVMADPPGGVNGADLLPLSLIGCSAWDIMSLLRQEGQQVSRLHVSAESVQDDDPPWRFRRIRVHYTFSGKGLEAAKVRQAMRESETRLCSIYITLRDSVELQTDFDITEDQ